MKTRLIALAALATLAGTARLAQAGTLPHNAVVGFKADVTDYQAKFQPRLKVVDGCVPFPAVDAAGNTNAGLQPTGSRNGECGSSSGQVYVRAQVYNGECAVMYSWYFPKDLVIVGQGHRHDWENVVLWLSSCSANANINAVAYSGHGGYVKQQDFFRNGNAPQVKYGTDGIRNHQLFNTSESGGFQPAIRWLGLTAAARNALTNTDFGSANVPFKDANFTNNLAKAWYR